MLLIWPIKNTAFLCREHLLKARNIPPWGWSLAISLIYTSSVSSQPSEKPRQLSLVSSAKQEVMNLYCNQHNSARKGSTTKNLKFTFSNTMILKRWQELCQEYKLLNRNQQEPHVLFKLIVCSLLDVYRAYAMTSNHPHSLAIQYSTSIEVLFKLERTQRRQSNLLWGPTAPIATHYTQAKTQPDKDRHTHIHTHFLLLSFAFSEMTKRKFRAFSLPS